MAGAKAPVVREVDPTIDPAQMPIVFLVSLCGTPAE